MAKAIYLTDPVVAAVYHVAPGQFAPSVADDEAAWLVANHHGYPIDGRRAMPAAGFVHPSAPLPFVSYPGGSTQPANMTTDVREIQPGVFTVGFGSTVDTDEATVHCEVTGTDQASLANLTYAQPALTTDEQAAEALAGALASIPALGVNSGGPTVGIQGVPPAVVGAVVCQLTIPGTARAPATRRTLTKARS